MVVARLAGPHETDAGSQLIVMPDASMLPAAWRRRIRSLAGAYAVLAGLAVAAWALPHLPGWVLGVAIVLFALPAMPAAWHRGTVRRLARLHEFAAGHWLRRWAARRLSGQAATATLAIVAAAAVLLQAPYFGALEWSLAALSPLVYLGWSLACLARARPLFSHPVYAVSAATRLARALTFATLCLAWFVGRSLHAEPPAAPLAEIVYALQSRWPQVSSAIVRLALDAGAWAQGTLATLGSAAPAPPWRVALALLVLPVTVFGYATAVAASLSLPRHEYRRIFAATLTADEPPALPRRRRRAYAVATGLAALALIGLVWRVDAALGGHERWLALRALPACERIGGTAYAVGTLARAAAFAGVLEEGMAARRASACARLDAMERIAAVNVDAYLDWYFSLGAEWMRMALLVTGDVDTLLEVRFNKLVAGDPRLATLIAELDADRHYLVAVASAGHRGLGQLLDEQRLVLDERQCRVTAETNSVLPALPRYDGVRARLLASTATGVVAGAFAGALTARAMARASMQTAGRVLGKVAARQGAARLGAAAAGAATGAVAGSAVPGLGTGIGAVAGAATGLAIGAGVDVAMLAVEEKLTRADLRRDLLAAVTESLAPLRTAFECGGK